MVLFLGRQLFCATPLNNLKNQLRTGFIFRLAIALCWTPHYVGVGMPLVGHKIFVNIVKVSLGFHFSIVVAFVIVNIVIV